MADDIQNPPAPILAVEQPPVATHGVEEPVNQPPPPTEAVGQPSDQMMVDSSTTNEATTSTTTNDNLTENHSAQETENQQNPEAPPVEKAAEDPDATENDMDESAGDADGDVDMSDHNEYSDDGSEYEPEAETPPPAARTLKQPKTKSPASVRKTPIVSTPNPNPNLVTTAAAVGGENNSLDPQTPQGTRLPKTPTSRVRSGRIDKSATPGSQGNLRCPVKGCGQTFTGRNPRQSLWHHLKYYATRGLPDRAEFEKAHGEAHAEMKRDAEPKGTPVERNRISSSDYRKKNPEKAKTSARLSNFRARARKKGITDEREIEENVLKWEKEWQEKQAKEASEYFSGILLSAFE